MLKRMFRCNFAWQNFELAESIYAYTDSSGAKGILQRSGVGRLRHLSCRILWLQQLVSGGMVKLCSVSGSVNPADIGTKRVSAPRLRSLMAVLGLYNRTTGSLEGSDDPGKVFIKKHNVRPSVRLEPDEFPRV